MCGICGAINLNPSPSLLTLVREANGKLKHRGPDDEGYALFDGKHWKFAYGDDTPTSVIESHTPYTPEAHWSNFAELPYQMVLGHRRLSILDLSPTGHQPLSVGRTIVVHNGEIYNYIELREELKSVGYQFHSHTDTEVLLHAWQYWGEEMLYKLNGMFAFAIVDTEKQLLFAARDRTGVKPFYYSKQQDHFVFASEIKALPQRGQVNNSAAIDYLIFNKSEAEPESMVKGIMELAPGHALHLKLDSLQLTLKHWQKQEEKKELWLSDYKGEASEHLQALFLNSIKLRMRSDTAVAACVSGGIDSSAIACSLKYSGVKEMKLFSALFPEASNDEKKWAELVANQTGYEWIRVFPTAETLLADFENFVHSQDLPVYSLSAYSQYFLMKCIKMQGVKVTLDGQGADELFAGYRRHMAVYAIEAMRTGKLNIARKLIQQDAGVREIMMKKAFAAMLPAKEMAKRYLQGHPAWEYLHPDHRNMAMKKTTVHFATLESASLNNDLHKEYFGTPLKVLLRVSDRSSMQHGVESRMPFADDPTLMYFGQALSPSLKINENMGKWILREAMKGITVEAILQRKDKTGFATPEVLWLTQCAEQLWENLPGNSNLLQVARIKKDQQALLQKAQHQHLHKVWRLLNYLSWEKSMHIE